MTNELANALPVQLFLLFCSTLGRGRISLSHEHVHYAASYNPSNCKLETLGYIKGGVSNYERLLLLGSVLRKENWHVCAVLPR